ncbi:MAG: 50S ribosomal protein L18 [Candidatus Omnitrophota bacterium]
MRKKIRNQSEYSRIKRHYRIRKNVFGTKEKPRLSIHRSNKNIYAQLIDDLSNTTLLSLSTNDKDFKKDNAWGGNVGAAKKLGLYVSGEAKKKGIEQVVFDRGGYLYHGRVKAFADAAREAGLKF